jgi:hypothetical protein
VENSIIIKKNQNLYLNSNRMIKIVSCVLFVFNIVLKKYWIDK